MVTFEGGQGKRAMRKSGASNVPCCEEACAVVRVHVSMGDPWVSGYVRRGDNMGECNTS